MVANLSCKMKAHAWGVSVEKTTQAGDPAFAKIAASLALFPVETLHELSRRAQQITEQWAAEGTLETRVRQAHEMRRTPL